RENEPKILLMSGPSRYDRFIDGYYDFLVGNRLRVTLIALAILAVAAALTTRLSLKTNISELLPQKLESVQNLRAASDRLGGTGILVVGVQGPRFENNRRFVEDLAQKLQPMVGKDF